MKYYRAEIEDDNFEMILADSEEDAIASAYCLHRGQILFPIQYHLSQTYFTSKKRNHQPNISQ